MFVRRFSVVINGEEEEGAEIQPWRECADPFPEGEIDEVAVEARRHTCIVLSHDKEIALPGTRKIVVIPTIGYNEMAAPLKRAILEHERLEYFPLPADESKGMPARYADFSGTFSVPKKVFGKRGMKMKARLNSPLLIQFMNAYANWLMRIKAPSPPTPSS